MNPTDAFVFHAEPRFPRGFRCASGHCGLKPSGNDLSLFASDVPCAAAAVFTRNHVPGAPVIVGRELIRAGRLQAVVVNSRISNVGTGEEGIARARRMGAAAAKALGIDPALVLMSSTGVIGAPLPVERIEAALPGLAEKLQGDPLVGARGIMTTDTHPKALSLSLPGRRGRAEGGEDAEEGAPVITIVAKGSGMIEPNMATMLVYVFTDAALDAGALDAALRAVVDVTFNMLSVDGDTSTSDTCAILANGLAGAVGPDAFRAALLAACTRMVEVLARDGEGATRLFRATVSGAAARGEAVRVAKSLVNSPLMKTMVYGGDPNVGRILMAVGKCFDCRVDPGRIDAWIAGVPVLRGGRRADFDEAHVRALLAGDPVDVVVDLGQGGGEARAWGCDLGPGYVTENAAYASS